MQQLLIFEDGSLALVCDQCPHQVSDSGWGLDQLISGKSFLCMDHKGFCKQPFQIGFICPGDHSGSPYKILGLLELSVFLDESCDTTSFGLREASMEPLKAKYDGAFVRFHGGERHLWFLGMCVSNEF